MEEIIASNPQNNIPYINKFNLTGSVVHKYRPRPDVIVLTIAVKGHELHEADYPNVAFYGQEIVDSIDKSISVEGRNYARVHIEGVIQTTRRETDEGVRFFQSLVGSKIYRTQTQMEQLSGKRGVGTHKAESENTVCVLGQVTNVWPMTRAGSDRVIGVTVTIRTQTDGRTNFPRIVCFNTNVPRALALKPGEIVCATAFMETTNRNRPDGSRARYESAVATEIVKVDPDTQS